MPFRVLFVCTGNVCRSPAAESLLRDTLDVTDELTVSSAGTSALVGERMSEPMASLVAAHGSDPTQFRAQQLTARMLRDADLVVTMTSAQRTEAVTMSPGSVQFAYTLGQLGQMLAHVDGRKVESNQAAPDVGTRLAAAVSAGRHYRALGVDPADDVIDPYGRSASVYARSFKQILDGLSPLIRLAAPPR